MTSTQLNELTAIRAAVENQAAAVIRIADAVTRIADAVSGLYRLAEKKEPTK